MNKAKKITIIDLGGVNCYLVAAEKGFVLVDTGGHLSTDRTFDSRREKLMAALTAAGCHKGELRLILLTHGDNDHAANAAYLRGLFDAPIAIHPGDLSLVSAPTLGLLMESYKYRSAEYQQMFLQMKDFLTGITRNILEDFESFQPDILLYDGMRLDDFGLDAAVLHLPGHTDGSAGLLLSDGSLLAGDTLLNVEKPDLPPNAADFNILARSVERLQELNIKTVYPGHGSVFCFTDYRY